MKVQELDGGMKLKAGPHRKPSETRTCAVRMFTRDVQGAEVAFAALTSAGMDSRSISVIASGPEVDRKLIFDPERNANQLAAATVPVQLSGLAQKLSNEKKHLFEGCWASGPLFDCPSSYSGYGGETLVKALLRAGFSLKESTGIESALKCQGGVWLTACLDRRAASRAAEALHEVPGLEVEWAAAPSYPTGKEAP